MSVIKKIGGLAERTTNVFLPLRETIADINAKKARISRILALMRDTNAVARRVDTESVIANKTLMLAVFLTGMFFLVIHITRQSSGQIDWVTLGISLILLTYHHAHRLAVLASAPALCAEDKITLWIMVLAGMMIFFTAVTIGAVATNFVLLFVVMGAHAYLTNFMRQRAAKQASQPAQNDDFE